jgi:hypothetical protein
MAKPSCVVLHMVASNQKDGGRWRWCIHVYRRVAAVCQDMKNNVVATMVRLLFIRLVSCCHMAVTRFVHNNTQFFYQKTLVWTCGYAIDVTCLWKKIVAKQSKLSQPTSHLREAS